jgi:hypothetical protein
VGHRPATHQRVTKRDQMPWQELRREVEEGLGTGREAHARVVDDVLVLQGPAVHGEAGVLWQDPSRS